jgi:hypothetical protein
MTRDDDRKGEARIRVPAKSAGERRSESLSLAGRLDHARRRATGCGMSRAGGTWARRIHASAVHARIMRGDDEV